MINPDKITEYYAKKNRLEEAAIFWIAVAGKSAKQIAPRINSVLRHCHQALGLKGWQPFRVIRETGEANLKRLLKYHGIGCHSMKARGMYEIATSRMNLRTCSVQQLDAIHGVGLKSASCFVMHTRPDARCAGLDTHILKFLAALGHEVPKSTPGSGKLYHRIESIFLKYVDTSKRTCAQLDLLVWRAYSRHKHLTPWLIRIFSHGQHKAA